MRSTERVLTWCPLARRRTACWIECAEATHNRSPVSRAGHADARANFRITASLRQDSFDTARPHAAPALELQDATLGIVGLGQIGARLARICKDGFGMQVLGNQRRMDKLPQGVEGVTLDSLLERSDYVVLACPLNAQTQHLMNRTWVAFLAPAGTPPEIVRRLSAETAKAVGSAAFRERFSQLAIEPVGHTSEQLGKFLNEEIVKWAKVINTTGVKAEQ